MNTIVDGTTGERGDAPAPLSPSLSLFLCCVLVATHLAACGHAPPKTPAPDAPNALHATHSGEHSPAVQAAESSVEAAQSESAPLIDGLELRVRDISGETFADGQGPELGLRLPVENPWVLDAEDSVRDARVDQALAELGEATLREEVERCRAGYDVAWDAQRREEYAAFEVHMQAVNAWNTAWDDARSIDPFAAAELELSIRRRLLQEEPPPMATRAVPAQPLPALSPPKALPVRDADQVVALVRAHHPAIAALNAEANRQRAFVEREENGALPWLDLLEVAYQPGPDNGPDNVSAMLAVEVPFGRQESAAAHQHDALARRAELQRDATARELALEATDALLVLEHFGATSERLAALNADAQQAFATAMVWTEERQGEPRRAAALVEEGYLIRAFVLNQRYGAAQARCALLGASGVSADAWPPASAAK